MARKEVLFNEEDYTRKYYLETLKMLKEDDVDCDWEEDNDTDFMDWESTQKGWDFIETAIHKCVDGCEIRSIIRKGNHIEVNVYHHDGSNSFKIFVLNDLGLSRYRRNGKVSIHNPQNIFKIPKCIF